MPYKVRKLFHDQGVNHHPGEIIDNIDHYPRPESMIRGGWLVWVESGTKPETEESDSSTGTAQATIDFGTKELIVPETEAKVASDAEMTALVNNVVDMADPPKRRGRPRKVDSNDPAIQ